MMSISNPFRVLRGTASLVVCAGLAAGLATPLRAEGPLRVMATVGMIGDVVAELGGACTDVSVLVGPGSDPHLYQPRASDVRALQEAGLILYVGHGLEGRLASILERLAEDRPVRAIGHAILPEAEALRGEDAAVDPHLWMDPAIWARGLPVIAQEITALRPDCAAAVAERQTAYAAQLLALDGWVRDSVATLPPEARVLVTAHDAFGYYASAYGLRQEAIQGLSTESEASIADIRSIAEIVVETGVPAVFVESTINPRVVRAMVDAVAAMGGTVRIGGSLYSDAMGDPGTATGSYVGMIHANTTAIVTALGGTPAPLPEALHPWADRWGLPR